MARIEDEIGKIADPVLRTTILAEVKKLKAGKRFGLVFEEHLPELVPVYSAKVKARSLVSRRSRTLGESFKVVRVQDGMAEVEMSDGSRENIPVEDLTVVRRFGEPIYPALLPFDRVRNGDTSQPHHILIEADNYHALQLLEFCYSGKVDCIYIDPPYNTGAKDWKYNNDYVDNNDAWRHSKWLSMMKKRLLLAKRLLNPADSVLIVTIDEKEYLRLGLLLEQLFPEAAQQMVTIVINPNGVARGKELARVEEYAFFLFFGEASPALLSDSLLDTESTSAAKATGVRWEWLMRGGSNSRRQDRPNLFFPIFIDPERKVVVEVGEALPLHQPKASVEDKPGLVTVWPIRTTGEEANWRTSPSYLRELLRSGHARVGAYDKKNNRWSMLYLGKAQIRRIAEGEIEVTGQRDDGSLHLESTVDEAKRIPKTVWNRPSHKAGEYGSLLVKRILGGRAFPFPKSLYAVEDALRIVVAEKPKATVLDFFSGSGTTAHAVMRLNRQDNGRRQCISVTNNEVAADEQAALRERGLQPGDPEWEKWGICRFITMPRLGSAMTGKTPDGEPIRGDYKFTDEFPMAEGFPANLEYFKLDFLDPADVQMGRQFAAILPILWMMAGARGPLPEAPDHHAPWLVPTECPFAVLMQEKRFKDFQRNIEGRNDLTHVFIVTNSTSTCHKLREELKGPNVVQLYKDYLQNFKINYGKDAP